MDVNKERQESFLSVHNDDRTSDIVAVDESMVRFKGRSTLKQYNPMKPIKRGYKIWVLADKSGYFLDGEIYTGRVQGNITKDLGGNVVRKLTQPLQGGNHKVFFDNYFTRYKSKYETSVTLRQ